MRDRFGVSRCCCVDCELWSDYFATNTIADYTQHVGTWSISGGMLSTSADGIIVRTASLSVFPYIFSALVKSPGSGNKVGVLPSYNHAISEYTVVEITWDTPITYEVYRKYLGGSPTLVGNGVIYQSTSADDVTVEIHSGGTVWLSVGSSYTAVTSYTGVGGGKIGIQSFGGCDVEWLVLDRAKDTAPYNVCEEAPVCSLGSLADNFDQQELWWGLRGAVGPESYEVDANSFLARRHDITYAYATAIFACKGSPQAGTDCSVEVDVSWLSGTYPIMLLRVQAQSSGSTAFAIVANTDEARDFPTTSGVTVLRVSGSTNTYQKTYTTNSATLKLTWTFGANRYLENIKYYIDGTLYYTEASVGSSGNAPLGDAYYIAIGSAAGFAQEAIVKDVRFSNFSYVES